MRRLLIVSPHFPPVNAPDAQRVLGALPHLHDLGWDSRVLCVDHRDIDLPADPSSIARLPEDVRVDQCRAWPLALTRFIGMRTLGPRASGSVRKAGAEVISEWKPDLVFFSTTQNAVVAAGPRWKKDHGVPFIVDVQDPWITDYYDRPGAPKPPGGWKYAWSRRRSLRLESEVFNAVDGVVSVSQDYLHDLNARHPRLNTIPQQSIPFGVDVFAFKEAVARAHPPFARESGKIHLVSMGAVGTIMRSAVDELCAQLRDLRRQHPALAARVRIHFIGTSYASRDAAEPSVMPAAAAHGVNDLVHETTERVSWREAQAGMAAADGLIVLTSEDPAYTPSKIAGCFLARRPVLMVTRPESATARLAKELGLGLCMNTDATTPEALHEFITDMQSEHPSWSRRRRDEQFEMHHTTEARTRELALFFQRVIQNSKHRP
jgi:glycosyltransferase involved in cell wall biosynthesis